MMEIHLRGDADPAEIEAVLRSALGRDDIDVVLSRPRLELDLATAPVDLEVVREAIDSFEPAERAQLRDQLVTKARAVWNETDTFTAAQAQKILAGLVLLEARRR